MYITDKTLEGPGDAGVANTPTHHQDQIRDALRSKCEIGASCVYNKNYYKFENVAVYNDLVSTEPFQNPKALLGMGYDSID